MERFADISSCGRYRWSLARVWGDGPWLLFVMLNPSTADAKDDDPTIRRCVGFAKAWGYKQLAVMNLFAFRATDPRKMLTERDPVGSLNGGKLIAIHQQAKQTICAWGAHGSHMGQGLRVAEMLRQHKPVYHLGLTKAGHPRHPLYLRANTKPILWESP